MSTEQTTAIDPAAAAAENAEVRANNDAFTDNTNPDAGIVEQTTTETTTEAPAPAEAPKYVDPRVRIAAGIKARREAAAANQDGQSSEPEALLQTDHMGNVIPPFAQPKAEEPAPEPAKVEAPAQKTYDLKVNGKDIQLKSFDELAQAAGLKPDEARDLPEAALIKAARITLAAEARLAAAKEQARTADAPTATPADKSAKETGQGDAPVAPKAKGTTKDVIEKIQFSDPDEAAVELDAFIDERVSQALTSREQNQTIAVIQKDIATSVRSFEAANQDIMGDPDLSNVLYGRYVVDSIKDALVATGEITREAADKAVTNTQQALLAYEAARFGNLQISNPSTILTEAAGKVRAKFGKQAPATTPSTSPAQVNPRVEAKRGLTPQPTRAAAPLPVARPTNGQNPDKRSHAVAEMQRRRGQRLAA